MDAPLRPAELALRLTVGDLPAATAEACRRLALDPGLPVHLGVVVLPAALAVAAIVAGRLLDLERLPRLEPLSEALVARPGRA